MSSLGHGGYRVLGGFPIKVARISRRGSDAIHSVQRRCRHDCQHRRWLRHNQHDALGNSVLSIEEPRNASKAAEDDRPPTSRRGLRPYNSHTDPGCALPPSRDQGSAAPTPRHRPPLGESHARGRRDDMQDGLSTWCKLCHFPHQRPMNGTRSSPAD
jgi:hypothetical protein